jgi:hypothetical protein
MDDHLPCQLPSLESGCAGADRSLLLVVHHARSCLFLVYVDQDAASQTETYLIPQNPTWKLVG